MNSNLCEVVCILDRSGSMSSIINDAIGGLNTFLAECRNAPEQRKATIVLFDEKYDMPYNCVDVKNIPDFTLATYTPRGSTALYDAVGKTIDAVGARLTGTPEYERPASVIVVIVTDGEENASKEYTSSRIKSMIETQTNQFSWTFIFLAANQDAVTAAGNIGIAKGNSLNFMATGASTRNAYDTLSRCATYASKSMSMMSMGDCEYAPLTDVVYACNNNSNDTK
jgi:uncharacterized protein YegL